MRTSKFLVCAAATLSLLAFANVSIASIIGYNCDDDGDGAIIMQSITWDQNTYDLWCYGDQYDYPAHVVGDFTTDTELDPTVRIRNTVENDTDFAWSDYHINISMNKHFDISDVVGDTGWTHVITAPSDPENDGTWVGTIDYYQGTGDKVLIGNDGEYDYKISFLGSIAYTQEMIPTPEPMSMTLLLAGAGLLLRRRRA